MHLVNVPPKFEVRSFTRSLDNRGTRTPNISARLDTPMLQNFNALVFGWTL